MHRTSCCYKILILVSILLAVFSQPSLAASTQNQSPFRSTQKLLGIDGFRRALILGAKPTVFIFLIHDCPIGNAYAPTISKLERQYGKRVAFYEVYTDSDIKPGTAKKHHHDFGLHGIGLLDPKGRLVKKLGAKISPEAFVLDARGKIAYHGRIDNTYSSVGVRRNITTKFELKDALNAVLAGKKPAVAYQPASGCFLSQMN